MRPTKSRPLANVLRVAQTEVAAALQEFVHAKRATVTAVMSKRHPAERIAVAPNRLQSQFRRPLATVAPLDAVQSNTAFWEQIEFDRGLSPANPGTGVGTPKRRTLKRICRGKSRTDWLAWGRV